MKPIRAIILMSILCVLAAVMWGVVVAAGQNAGYPEPQRIENNLQSSPINTLPYTLTHVYSLGGPMRSFVVSGSLAFAGEGHALNVLDVSDPAALPLMARLPLTSTPKSIQLAGDRLYIASDKGLSVVDITQPLDPQLVGVYPQEWDIQVWSSQNLFLEEPRAFVANGETGVAILGIDSTGIPEPLGQITYTANDIWADGDLLYVLGDALRMVDVGDPKAPMLLATYPLTRTGRALYLSGENLYAAVGGEMLIFNISSPTQVMLSSRYAVSSGFSSNNLVDLFIQDNRAILLTSFASLDILFPVEGCLLELVSLENSQPSPISQVYYYEDGWNCNMVLADGDRAYFLKEGFNILDISIPTTPVILGKQPSPQIQDFAFNGDIGYFIDEDQGLFTLDWSHPTSPTWVGPGISDNGFVGVVVEGSRLFIREYSYGHPRFPGGALRLYSLEGINPPSYVSTLADRVYGVAAEGNLVYIIDHIASFPPVLGIMDISNPASPHELTSFFRYEGASWSSFGGIDVERGFVYAQIDQYGLPVIDARDPVTPVVLNIITPPGQGDHINDFQVQNNRLYLVDNANGFFIYDTTDPFNPKLLSQTAAHGTAYDLHAADGFVYLAEAEAGVEVWNVIEPTSPVLAAHYDGVIAYGVEGQWDRVYIRDNEYILHLLEMASLHQTYLPLLGNNSMPPLVTYRAYARYDHWLPWQHDNGIAGLTGYGRPLEGFQIQLVDPDMAGQITYQVYLQDIGWMDWVSDGVTAGLPGESKQVEGIRIQLEGTPPGIEVFYQPHVQDFGWMEWVSEGEIAGVINAGKRLEALRIRLVDNR